MQLMPIAAAIVVGENAHFLVSDGAVTRTVVVTPEALASMTGDALAPVSEIEHLVEAFTKIAEANLANERQYSDERIWVLAADVRQWLVAQSGRWRPQRPAVFLQPSTAATATAQL